MIYGHISKKLFEDLQKSCHILSKLSNKVNNCHVSSCQVLIQGLQNLNRAVNQDVVAIQLLPRSQWVAPSSVVLQDEGKAKDDEAAEQEAEEEAAVNFPSGF